MTNQKIDFEFIGRDIDKDQIFDSIRISTWSNFEEFKSFELIMIENFI